MFNFIFRVGTKENGTRFLTFVDAVLGYRHLLQQSDLDKALSLCAGMRGKLKSRFVVLSDERVLPPRPPRTQGARGKRKQDEMDDTGSKRGRSGRPTTVSGVTLRSGRTTPVPMGSQVVSGGRTTPVPMASQVASGGQVAPAPGGSQVFSGSNTVPLGQPKVAAPTSRFLPALLRASNPYLRNFEVPPPVAEEGSLPSSEPSTEDWASAHSDETIIQ